MIYVSEVAVDDTELSPTDFDGPAVAVAGQKLERPEALPDAEHALLSAMHLLTRSEKVDLPWMLNRFAEAIGAARLTLYVLGESDEFTEQRSRTNGGASGTGGPGAGNAGPVPASQPRALLSSSGTSRARREAGTRADVYVSQAAEQDRLLKNILHDHASGWLMPVVSPVQRLHGYLDALPADWASFGKPEIRALHYLCSLLAGYFDRWETMLSDHRRGQRLVDGRHAVEEDGAAERRVVEALEEQQEHISKELHDNIGQLLTSIRMLGENVAARHPGTDESTGVGRIAELAGQAAVQVREIHQRLSAPDLRERTLATALKELAGRMDELPDAHCFFHCAGPELGVDLSEEAKLHLYRIAQEATNNAVKYARARRLQIALEFDEEGEANSSLVLRIQDDGQGFDPDDPEHESSSGLHNMAHRARAVGGTFQIDSAPGTGTTITCRVPQEPDG